MKKRFIFYLLPVLICCFLMAPAKILAQENSNVGIKVQPSIIEEKVEPGQTFSSVLHASNLGAEKSLYYVIKRDISSLDSEGHPIFAKEGEKTGYEISSWIQITSEAVEISGGGTVDIPYSITVPKDAAPGGHFGSIFLGTDPSRTEESGVGINYQVGTIINLRIAGEASEEARVREFFTDKAVYFKPSIKFTTGIENNGNTLIKPRGPIEIINNFGRKIAVLKMNDDAAAVFPGASRQFELVWSTDEILFGRYQAVMSLAYGDEEIRTISDDLSFWVLPLGIILPSAGAILALFALAYIFAKLHIRKKLRQSGIKDYSWKEKRKHCCGPSLAAIIIFVLAFALVLFILFA
ncbi:MAG: hypothetical protein WC430_00630 [Patescibacteria group bacterium]